jgi:hypothetical protein
MKKLFATLVLLAGFAANADYLYWMIDTGSGNGGAGGYTYDSINLMYGSTILQSASFSDNLGDMFSAGGYFEYSGEIIDSTGSSFWVELVSSGNSVAKSTPQYTYNELINMGALFKGSSMSSNVGNIASFGNFTSVPEPTSGVLFLIGGMLLGLKRRRMA